MEPTNTDRLASFECHKVVRAGKIIEVRAGKDNLSRHLVVEGAGGVRIGFDVSIGLVEHFNASGCHLMPGDYYVVYEDGYKSLSPRSAFEKGYSLKR